MQRMPPSVNCSNCSKILFTNIMTCSQCKLTHYCTVKCQKEFWNQQHKDECQELKIKFLTKKSELIQLPQGIFIESVNANTDNNKIDPFLKFAMQNPQDEPDETETHLFF